MITSMVLLIMAIVVLVLMMVAMMSAVIAILVVYTGKGAQYDRAGKKMAKNKSKATKSSNKAK